MTATTFDDPIDELREWLRAQWELAMDLGFQAAEPLTSAWFGGQAAAFERALDRIT